MAGNRIELWGRLAKAAELRITPAGSAVLRMAIRCGVPGDNDLMLKVVLMGESARQLAARIRPGDELRASGVVRSLTGNAGRSGIEVVADSVEPEQGLNQSE